MCNIKLLIIYMLVCLLPVLCSSEKQDGDDVQGMKLEVYDGVYLKIPRAGKDTKNDSLVSVQVDLAKTSAEGRSRNKNLMERILPLFIMPFILQSSIIPLFLSAVKFMLFKSLMVGKLAMALILINAFRNNNSFKGRMEKKMADLHYGYHGNGMEEYGAYFNN